METSTIQSSQSSPQQQQPKSICLPNQTAFIKEMQNMRLGPIQWDKFLLSGERVPILRDWHFQTHYRSHYRVPRQTNNTVTKTSSCQNSVRCSWWLHLQGVITVLCTCAHLTISIFETVLTRKTARVICSKMLALNELCDLCFLTSVLSWPPIIVRIMTILSR